MDIDIILPSLRSQSESEFTRSKKTFKGVEAWDLVSAPQLEETQDEARVTNRGASSLLSKSKKHPYKDRNFYKTLTMGKIVRRVSASAVKIKRKDATKQRNENPRD